MASSPDNAEMCMCRSSVCSFPLKKDRTSESSWTALFGSEGLHSLIQNEDAAQS